MATNLALSSDLTFDQLDFTQNCKAVANFTSLYFWGSRKKFIPTYEAIYRYVLTALPPSTKEPAKGVVMSWFERVHAHHNVTKYMYQEPFDACINETCQAISYSGNADIAGVGMLVAYWIEAIMATIYLIFRLVPMVKQRTMSPTRTRRPARGWTLKYLPHRFMDAIDFTVDDFLETALVFCFSIIIAGMVMISTSTKPYDMLQCTLVTAYSLSVVLAIWGLQKDSMRRELIRNCFFATIIVLAFFEIGVVVWTERSSEYITRREYSCLNEIFSSYERPNLFFILIQSFTGVAALLVLLVIVFETLPIPTKVKDNKLVAIAARIPWAGIACGYGFISVWLILGTLLSARRLVDRRMGISDAERSWGFGQVMALSTWLPTQVFFFDILIRGADEAEHNRIAPPWKVTYDAGRSTEVTENPEEMQVSSPSVLQATRGFMPLASEP